VDEGRWQASTDPETMLDVLAAKGKASSRKLRLVAIACCRRLWHLLLDERSRKGVEMLEQSVDGAELPIEFRKILQAAHAAALEVENGFPAAASAAEAATALLVAPAASALEFDTVVSVVLEATEAPGEAINSTSWCPKRTEAGRQEHAAQADLLRDIFGNPFRAPVLLETGFLHWDDGIVEKLARSIYDQGAFDRLPILADALEEAGFSDIEILEHLRGPGPHVRGCFVLDLLLGKR
jgi:hypothetical protein